MIYVFCCGEMRDLFSAGAEDGILNLKWLVLHADWSLLF